MKLDKDTKANFFVVAFEPGAENPSLPAWGNTEPNPAKLSENYDSGQVERHELTQVPGAFQLFNVLSKAECESLIGISEELGFLPDAPVSLPRSVRHNASLTWIVDEQTDGTIWQRIAHLMDDRQGVLAATKLSALTLVFGFIVMVKMIF